MTNRLIHLSNVRNSTNFKGPFVGGETMRIKNKGEKNYFIGVVGGKILSQL